MKSFFKDIFEYHHHFNQKLISEIKTHADRLPERTYPLFCHILNAHQIWNSRILNFSSFAVRQVHAIDSCADIDNKNYSDTLKIIESTDLEKIIIYTTFRGDKFSNSVRDILFHVANHSTHHKGQIISDFRNRDIEPLVTDYIFYRR